MAPRLGTGADLGRLAPLRPVVDIPPAPVSVFEDPGDEKSWHKSQRSEELARFYEDREPGWYASAVAPLKGADRVLDLGCGPGIALRALREQGSSSLWGVDRWPAFTSDSDLEATLIAHDLTLPMPFLASSSFDGILSHYVLDYISPIGMRQVLREARRLLVPGGLLVVYVAAVGLGGRDETRTVAYGPAVMRALLEEAGFGEIEVSAPNEGRNSVATARRSILDADLSEPSGDGARATIEGETQLAAGFSAGERIECELTGSGHGVTLSFDLPPARLAEDSRASACLRVQRSTAGGTELQVWAWRGFAPVVSERIRLESSPAEMRLACRPGTVEHVSVWSPKGLSLEPPGNAYALARDLPPGDELSEAERGAEGRQVVVEPPGGAAVDFDGRLGPGRNRFLIRRGAAADALALDREWLAGRAHGLLVTAEELDGEGLRDLLLWAGWRQALVYVAGRDWQGILAAVVAHESELQGPVVLVDPALGDEGEPGPLPSEVARFAAARPRAFVLLGARSRERSAEGDLERLPHRLLHGGESDRDGAAMKEANEALRCLTERTLLMRLRAASGRSPAEVGRRAVLP
jgi:SAM-dependent methyltransferase